MPQTQLRDETAAAIGQAVAQTWGAGASLDFESSGDAAAGAEGPSAAVKIELETGPETVWLVGDLPPGLPEAVAMALGGEVSAETPPLDASATRLSYRWGWAGRSGPADIYALPETWSTFGDGEPQADEAAGAYAQPAASPAAPASAAAEPRIEVPALLPSLAEGRRERPAGGIELLLDVPLGVTVELGRAQKQVRDILDLRAGSLIGLDRPAGEPVDVLVNGRAIARGEVVVIDENFGVRITDVLSQAERLNRLA